MKIQKIGHYDIVMSNCHGKANYFAWPSVAKLQNGKIAVVASGYRYEHICPFGKAVISYSEDEGKTYTAPAAVIDTPLDDRDAGILPFGTDGVIVTSFNNSVCFQKEHAGRHGATQQRRENLARLFDGYLSMVTEEEEKRYLGSEFCISRDGGVTFGEVYKSPVTSPHGPCLLRDGTVLWVGRTFSADDTFRNSAVKACRVLCDGTVEEIGTIPHVMADEKQLDLCEPFAIELPDGRIICHLRAQRYAEGGAGYFTTYQSESSDGGKTWSVPHAIIDRMEGAPSHLMLHSSGLLVATYGHREKPYGIRAMFSRDGGATWDAGYEIYTNTISADLGYPCSIELADQSILTVFYAHEQTDGPAVIMQQKWRMEDEI